MREIVAIARRLQELEGVEGVIALLIVGNASARDIATIYKDLEEWAEDNNLDDQYNTLGNYIGRATNAAETLADNIALGFCKVGRLAVELIDQLQAGEVQITQTMSELQAEASTYPTPIQAIIREIARDVDFAGARARLAELNTRLSTVKDIIKDLCGNADNLITLKDVTNLGEILNADGGKPSPADLVAPLNGQALLEDLMDAGKEVSRLLEPVMDQSRAIIDQDPQKKMLAVLAKPLRAVIRAKLTSSISPVTTGQDLSISDIYQILISERRDILDSTFFSSLPIQTQEFLVLPDGARSKLDSPSYTPPLTKDDLTRDNDQLAGDGAWLSKLSGAEPDAPLSDQEIAFLYEFVRELINLNPTPVVILRQVGQLIVELFSGKIYQFIDFARLREDFEDQLLALVPTKIQMSFGTAFVLGESVAAATLGIFRPGPGSALGIEVKIEMDLFQSAINNSPPQVEFNSVGTLGPFDVKLVGDLFDALTLKFASARFETRSGQKPRFDIVYVGHEIGPQLQFVKKFQKYLAPKDGSGAILNFDRVTPGIEAGYRLQLGDFNVGNLAISNVGLEATAILPFSGGDAVFKASLSSRRSPFTLTYAPYGGSGFFGIYANVEGIIGFEAGFEFGGSAVFAFGPLTGQGRLMTGLYIKQLKTNGTTVTEISMTFIAEGSAAIWIFGFAACLSLKMGMRDGNMVGEAVFSFSFSMGIADFNYSISMQKSEGEGFNGQNGNSSKRRAGKEMPRQQRADRSTGLRHKSLEINAAHDPAVIHKHAVCQGVDWRRYLGYFCDIAPPDDYFAFEEDH